MEQFVNGVIAIIGAFLDWSGGTGVLLFCILIVLLRILWHHGKIHEIARLHLLTSIPSDDEVGPAIEKLYGVDMPSRGWRHYLRDYAKENL